MISSKTLLMIAIYHRSLQIFLMSGDASHSLTNNSIMLNQHFTSNGYGAANIQTLVELGFNYANHKEL